MIVSPDLYSTSQANGTMNCGLQQYDTGRHSVFPGLVESHWLSHRAPLHTILKQEPIQDEYSTQYVKEDRGGMGFQQAHTPPSLQGNVYGFPTPPNPDYSGSPPREESIYQEPRTPGMGGDVGEGGSGEEGCEGLKTDGGRESTSRDEIQGRSSQSPSGASAPPAGSENLSNQQREKHQDHPESSQSSNSENEFYENGDSLRKLQMVIQRTGMISEEKLQCPMCEFSCSIRSQFNEHLLSHETKCTACDFNAESIEKLREHMKKAHEGLYEEEGWGDEEPGLSTPKVNSQGKVKTFRCKQCEFSAVTKLEFWEHSRSHIKQERLLTCPKCPFVTEYKHHLEYHLRNHFGSKPFKCDKCSYSCVNKSMLNSHLKSHSNVYQFRCSDCSYATKYCHSLKLHLRKYGHSPAMVLNPDGSPNPLPIVDVYGTRRGPKQKQKHHQSQNNLQQQSPEKAHHQLPMPMFNPYSLLPTQMPYYNLLNGLGGPYAFQQELKVDEKNNNIEKQEGSMMIDDEDEEEEGEWKVEENGDEGEGEGGGVPLDLTCPYPSESSFSAGSPEASGQSKNRRKGKAFKLDRIALRLHQQQSDDEVDTPKPPARNNEIIEFHQPVVVKEDHPPQEKDEKRQPPCKSPQVKSCEADSELKPPEKSEKTDEYNCNYCDISFKDIVMYTMHMGYHGYQDPFTCNMCGQQTTDKVSFFLHIARISHL